MKLMDKISWFMGRVQQSLFSPSESMLEDTTYLAGGA